MERFALGSRYLFSRLSDYEKKVYRDIYNCWVNGDSVAKISLPGSGFELPSGMKLHKIVTFIINENPHLFHLETSQFNYSRHGENVTIHADNVYTPEEYRQIYSKLISKVNQIAAKASYYRSDYEKLLFLHDFLAKNITYDKGAPDPRSQREAHTIVGALLKNACVCEGYARAYRLLCDKLRLSCIVACGDSTALNDEGPRPHAWNYVKLNRKVYHVDVTWDSGLIKDGCPISNYYFMRSDAVFSKDHSWDTTLFPPAGADYPGRGKIIESKWELEKYLCEMFKSGKRDILVQFSDSFPGFDALERLLDKIIARNPLVFLPPQGYSYTYYEGIKSASIHFN